MHLGVISIAVSHAAATAYSSTHRVTFAVGESHVVEDYEITFLGAGWESQPHRKSMQATFHVQRGADDLGDMSPRLNHYPSMQQPIGTPQVHSGLDEDLYLNLVNVGQNNESASLEILVRPLVWWLWFGGGLMALGTLIAIWPVRWTRRAADVVSTDGPAAKQSGRASS